MLTIRDSVEIDVPPSDLWRWLCELPAHYEEWHPAHRRCRVLKGHLWSEDSVLEMEEDLHGRRHRLRFRVTAVTPEREIAYRGPPGLRGRFILEPIDGRVRFTAELSFGLTSPVIGPLADRLFPRLFRRRLFELEAHQRQEGANLKRLLEAADSDEEVPR